MPHDADQRKGFPPSASLKHCRPALPTVQHAKDLNGVAARAVGNDIGRASDDEFASSAPPTRSAALRKSDQPADGGKNMLDLL
jgi:hypothetical protein